jgi:hypothetical protein
VNGEVVMIENKIISSIKPFPKKKTKTMCF